MRLLDRYLLVEWLKVFALALGAMLGLMVLYDMYDEVQDMVREVAFMEGGGARLMAIGRYYLLLLPAFVTVVLPMALMVSLLFVLGLMHRHHEIVAMRTAGLSLGRITLSLWIGGLVLSGVLLWFNLEASPKGFELARGLREQWRFEGQRQAGVGEDLGLVSLVTFDNRRDHRLWLMNRFSEYSYRAFGVSVYQRDAQGREVLRLSAREGVYREEAGHWEFKEGRRVDYDVQTGRPVRSKAFEQMAFPEFTEDPALMRALGKRPKDLSLLELVAILERVPPRENAVSRPHLVRYHGLLATPFLCLVIVAISVPFALGGVRVNPLVGVSKAVGVFFLHYVLSSVTDLLGVSGHLPALAAAWLPHLLVGAVAFAWFWRMR